MLKFVQDLVATVSYLIRLLPNWVQALVVSLVTALLQAWMAGQVTHATLGTWLAAYVGVWITTHAAEIFTSTQQQKDSHVIFPIEEPSTEPPAPFGTIKGPF